ncbi:MAG: molybdopterin-dependent oxidoreductase, partial [Coriobacteriales bacterium]|nr:molybdopterin-dependent oxidoreductase [Coriobacteriales bacterium]
AAYHPDRIKYPMKRSTPKGDDDPGWQRITWDEAYTTTVAKARELSERYGGNTIAGITGTSRVWCMGGTSSWIKMWGSVNGIQAWQVCKGPRHFTGNLVSQFAHSWVATVDRPRIYTAWGGSTEISNYDDSCRTSVEVAMQADYHIIVDPRLSNLGKEADYHLPLRPGTDGAMAMCWANVIVNNELYDDLYVKKWTNAPFLVVKDMDATGYPTVSTNGDPFNFITRLLKESDLVEGGDPHRFMVWDTLEDKFTYFDNATGQWEGEDWAPASVGFVPKQNFPAGVDPGWCPDPTPFDPVIDPALYGEYEVTLKDGSKHIARPVWEYYCEALEAYTPAKTQEITGVDAKLIEDAAKCWATRLDPTTGYGNGGLRYMLAIEHQGHAIQVCRTLDTLVQITGNMDTPAGNRGSTRSNIEGYHAGFGSNAPGCPPIPEKNRLSKCGIERFPLTKWFNSWADANSVWEAMATGNPYPVTMAMNSSGDFMCQGNTAYNWAALCGLDFIFEANLFQPPSAGVADILVPAQHWIEIPGCPRASQGSHGAMGAHVRCIEPLGEAEFDPIILVKFFEYAGMPYWPAAFNPNVPWPTEKDLLNDGVKYFRDSWDQFVKDFQEHGWWDVKVVEPALWGTYRRYETGALRSRNAGGILGTKGDYKPGFYTPTMKVEIWSTLMESYHPDQGWELPNYDEPPYSPVSRPDLTAEYPLIITTGRRIPVYFHSEHRQLPWCREQWPAPRIEIHPDTAEEYGIKQGDWVWIESPFGKIRQIADLYYGIDRGVVNCEHQWWFPELKQASKGHELCQVNHLVDRNAQDPHCGTGNVRAYLVKIYKATPE